MKRRIIKEEAAPEISPDNSIDNKILAFFTKAERAAISDGKSRAAFQATGMEESLKRRNLRFLLEADDEEEEDNGEPKINVETFASEVNRLIENFTSLVDTKGVILTMAKNYLKNAYTDKEVDEFNQHMENQYDITDEPKQEENQNNNFAVGARTVTA